MSDKKQKRISVSLSDEHRDFLERVAEEKKVSIAWVIRQAIEDYYYKDAPLFREVNRK